MPRRTSRRASASPSSTQRDVAVAAGGSCRAVGGPPVADFSPGDGAAVRGGFERTIAAPEDPPRAAADGGPRVAGWRMPVGAAKLEGEDAGGGGLQGGVVRLSPGEEVARGAVEACGASLHCDHAVGGGEAALEAVFGQQDRDAPLLVQAAQQPDQLVAGHRVELGGGLVEEDELGAGHQGRGEGYALQLAAGEGVDGAVEEVRDGERQRHLLDGAGAGGRRVAAHLQRQGDLGGDGGRDDLRLRVLGDVADDRGELAGAGGDRIDARDLDAALDLAAVEVRHQPAGGAQQGRLARRRAPRQHSELARRKGQRDVAQDEVYVLPPYRWSMELSRLG